MIHSMKLRSWNMSRYLRTQCSRHARTSCFSVLALQKDTPQTSSEAAASALSKRFNSPCRRKDDHATSTGVPLQNISFSRPSRGCCPSLLCSPRHLVRRESALCCPRCTQWSPEVPCRRHRFWDPPRSEPNHPSAQQQRHGRCRQNPADYPREAQREDGLHGVPKSHWPQGRPTWAMNKE